MIIRGTSRSSVARFLIRISHTHTHTPAQNRRRVAHGCALDFRRAGQMKWLPPSNQCCVAAAVRSYTKCRCRRCVRLLIIFSVHFCWHFSVMCLGSRESAGRCFCHSSIRVIVFVASSVVVHICRRCVAPQIGARIQARLRCTCVYWTKPMWLFGKVAGNQRWCERNRARLNVSCRLPRNHCVTLHILLRCAHTHTLKLPTNVEKEATSEWIFSNHIHWQRLSAASSWRVSTLVDSKYFIRAVTRVVRCALV